MSRLNSTPLIELPETFSVGPFETDCATPYSHNPWIDETSTANWMLQIECGQGHVFLVQGQGLDSPDLTNADERSAFLRFVCHVLVEKLNQNGLEEACESLAEFFQYYLPKESSAALSTPSNAPNRLLTSQVGTLRRVMPSQESRPFRISED
jgi:hypothetical protein